MTLSKIYRQNVAVIVLNASGLILACRRADRYKTWQIPQGGIEVGETPDQAMLRELEEEIGTNEVEVISRLPHTISYDWPKHFYYRGYHGQEQHYFLTRLKEGAKICLNAAQTVEFDDFEWMGMRELIKRTNGFKQEAYYQAFADFSSLTPNTIAE